MKPEQAFYHNHITKLPGHIQRVENSVGQGLPDVVWTYCGQVWWLELKAHDECLLRKEQYAWGMRNSANGGNILVIQLDTKIHTVNIWKYPSVKVETAGKYLRVINEPYHRLQNPGKLREMIILMHYTKTHAE